jgi:hypothetical protein
MAFVLLIVEKREDRLNRPKDVGQDAYAQMVRFAEGVRIETRGGKRSMMDGPFAESKEFVGGFFLIDCPTKEQAIAIANECPAVAWATVEVRETGPCHGD